MGDSLGRALEMKADLAAVLDRLMRRIDYNAHDLGELGRFVRIEYVRNFIADEKAREGLPELKTGK